MEGKGGRIYKRVEGEEEAKGMGRKGGRRRGMEEQTTLYSNYKDRFKPSNLHSPGRGRERGVLIKVYAWAAGYHKGHANQLLAVREPAGKCKVIDFEVE